MQGDPLGHCRAVVGVGLNVQTPMSVASQIDQPWSDLRTVGLKASVTRNQLASRVARAIFQSFMTEPEQWRATYAKHDALMGRSVRILSGGDDVHGLACGINHAGELQVNVDGREQAVRSGEVSVRTHA